MNPDKESKIAGRIAACIVWAILVIAANVLLVGMIGAVVDKVADGTPLTAITLGFAVRCAAVLFIWQIVFMAWMLSGVRYAIRRELEGKCQD